MRLLEHEAKGLLREAGIPVPPSRFVRTAEDLRAACAALPFPRMVKAQVPVGGRGKAGGVLRAATREEAERRGEALLAGTLRGLPVEGLLLEEPVAALEEFFLALTYDSEAKRPVVLASRRGGIEVEAFARDEPAALARVPVNPRTGLQPFEAGEVARRLGFGGPDLTAFADLISRTAQAFLRMDATLLEINPLARTGPGAFVALDAHLELDDDALYRHPELERVHGIGRREGAGRPATALEAEAARIDALDHRGVAGRVIEFEGELGLLIGGGGASLTAFDAIRRHGGRPANYCEIGGNPSVRKVRALTELLLKKRGVRRLAVIMNVVSNTRVDLVARGVIKGCLGAGREPREVIAVFRVPGAWEEEGQKILRKYGVPFCDRTVSIDEAARIAAGVH
ncbi:MAG: acetate--CoA ligase family protein [candidate division NC10 bacterium]|nr:acetate--CoA ligase family protein [candidate division NC10 bacterium]